MSGAWNAYGDTAANSREWERVISEALAREERRAARDAQRDIGTEKWVWNAVKPSPRDHIPNCGDVALPDPETAAKSLSRQVIAALCTAWRTGPDKLWRVSKDNAKLLRPHGLCEANRGVFLTNYGVAVRLAVIGGDS